MGPGQASGTRLGQPAPRLLLLPEYSTKDPAKWDQGKWDPAKWDQGKWDPAKWDQGKWDPAKWDQGKWDPAKWDQGKWDQARSTGTTLLLPEYSTINAPDQCL